MEVFRLLLNLLLLDHGVLVVGLVAAECGKVICGCLIDCALDLLKFQPESTVTGFV